MKKLEAPALMSPADVAQAFGCNVKTVARWAKRGQLPFIWTPGGHRRYRRSDIEALLNTPGGPR